MLFWEKKEGVERGRGVLGGDERRAGREKVPHTTLPHSIYIEGGAINLYWSAGEPILVEAPTYLGCFSDLYSFARRPI